MTTQLPPHTLIQLRGTQENATLARRALGPDASAAAVKSLANYFSRIVHGGVPKVGLEMLQLLATGMGYTSLGTFLLDWEWVASGKALAYPGYGAERLHKKASGSAQSSSPPPRRSDTVPDARKPSRAKGSAVLEDYERAALQAAAQALIDCSQHLGVFTAAFASLQSVWFVTLPTSGPHDAVAVLPDAPKPSPSASG